MLLTVKVHPLLPPCGGMATFNRGLYVPHLSSTPTAPSPDSASAWRPLSSRWGVPTRPSASPDPSSSRSPARTRGRWVNRTPDGPNLRVKMTVLGVWGRGCWGQGIGVGRAPSHSQRPPGYLAPTIICSVQIWACPRRPSTSDMIRDARLAPSGDRQHQLCAGPCGTRPCAPTPEPHSTDLHSEDVAAQGQPVDRAQRVVSE